jgi:hypothetical protein
MDQELAKRGEEDEDVVSEMDEDFPGDEEEDDDDEDGGDDDDDDDDDDKEEEEDEHDADGPSG